LGGCNGDANAPSTSTSLSRPRSPATRCTAAGRACRPSAITLTIARLAAPATARAVTHTWSTSPSHSSLSRDAPGWARTLIITVDTLPRHRVRTQSSRRSTTRSRAGRSTWPSTPWSAAGSTTNETTACSRWSRSSRRHRPLRHRGGHGGRCGKVRGRRRAPDHAHPGAGSVSNSDGRRSELAPPGPASGQPTRLRLSVSYQIWFQPGAARNETPLRLSVARNPTNHARHDQADGQCPPARGEGAARRAIRLEGDDRKGRGGRDYRRSAPGRRHNIERY